MEPRERFARNLKRRRLDKNLSQEALGHLADLHLTEVSRLERGGRDPQLATIVKLSRALRISVADLLDGVK